MTKVVEFQLYSNVSKVQISQTKKLSSGTLPLKQKGHGITVELLSIFKFLRVLGRCPLIFDINEDNSGFSKVHYRFKPSCNSEFILSAIIAIFVSTCCFLNVIHSFSKTPVFGDLWPATILDSEGVQFWASIKPMPRLILNSFEIVLSLMAVVEYIIIWLTSPILAKWLNTWNEIDDDFKACIGNVYQPDVSRSKNYFAIPYIIVLTLVMGATVACYNFDTGYPFGVVVVFTSCFITAACYHGEDAKIVLMFTVLEKSFKQIRQSVQIRFDERNSLLGGTNIQEIRTWHRILVKVRKQADYVGKYLCYMQLICITSLLYFIASSLFIIANLIGQVQSNHNGFILMTIIFITFFSTIIDARLYVKIAAAVRITEEEHRLAKLLQKLELVEYEATCRQEIKEIHTTLLYRPTEISLNNYVTLNNSLFLKIFGQALTQFICLIQFQNSI